MKRTSRKPSIKVQACLKELSHAARARMHHFYLIRIVLNRDSNRKIRFSLFSSWKRKFCNTKVLTKRWETEAGFFVAPRFGQKSGRFIRFVLSFFVSFNISRHSQPAMKYAAAYSSALSLSSMRICFESALAGKQTLEIVAKITRQFIILKDQFFLLPIWRAMPSA